MPDSDNNKIRRRQPRATRNQPYTKVNAYTLVPCKQQIMTFALFVAQLALHQIFLTPPIARINNPILWCLLVFHYLLLIFIGRDYIYLTVNDPVDRLILDETNAYKFKDYQLKKCSICNSQVQRSSHHCMTCNRCTQDFDHHCKYLNNCIGVRNYEEFLRILTLYTFYNLISIGHSIWILTLNENQFIVSTVNKWIVVGYLVLTVILGLAVGILLGFHVYISCCINMTTLEYIYRQPENKKPKQQNKFVIHVEPPPLSAQHLNSRPSQQKISRGGINIVSRGQNEMSYYRK